MKETKLLPPQAIMMQMINGKLVSRCISLVADLGIADLLRGGPQDSTSLANSTGTDPEALFRVMRMLAGVGVFVERLDREFEQSPLSEVLCSDAEGSVRQYARWLGTEFHWRVIKDLDYSVRTGRCAVTKDTPDQGVFDVLARHPGAQDIFNDAMTGLSLADGAAIVAAYDFSPYERITDVGGGHGTLATLIAQSAPNANVTVFDLPHVAEGTASRLAAQSPSKRIATVAGDFFAEVPGPTDLCVLKHIIHDWDDVDAGRILAKCRDALAGGGRILVCEMMITPGPESLPAKLFDIEMLVGPGGRERTEAEFTDLFRNAGLQLVRVIETNGQLRLLETKTS